MNLLFTSSIFFTALVTVAILVNLLKLIKLQSCQLVVFMLLSRKANLIRQRLYRGSIRGY